MSEKINVVVGVEVEVDPDVWQRNYGLSDSRPAAIAADVRLQLVAETKEQLNMWMIRTGNRGRVVDAWANNVGKTDRHLGPPV